MDSDSISPSNDNINGTQTRHTPYGGTLVFKSISQNPLSGYDNAVEGSESYAYTYSYGPPGVPGLLHNYYALICAAFASIGGLTFGYDQGVIANVLVMKDFRRRWPVGAWETGIMSAYLFFFLLTHSFPAARSNSLLFNLYYHRHHFVCQWHTS